MKDRHLDISGKLIEMGQSLMLEGNKSKDINIEQTGSFMILIGGLILDEGDVLEFGRLCSMYSAKKILDNLESTVPNFSEFLKSRTEDESYDDLIKRINKMRGDNGHLPLE